MNPNIQVPDRLTVYLHVAIPTCKENQPLALSLKHKVKRLMRQPLDWLAWSWNHSFIFKGYNYNRVIYSNRGDIAIKLAIKELLLHSLNGYAVEFIESEWGHLDALTLESINQRAALFVIAGGGYWVFSQSRTLSPSFMADSPYLEQMRCPVVVLGSGVNFNLPSADAVLDSCIGQELKDALLRFDQQVSLFAVRGKSSLEFLRAVGLQKPQLLCDPAIFKQFERMPAHTTKDNAGSLAIGINFAFHGSFVEQLFKKNIAMYIAFLKVIAEKFSPRFYYFIHSDEEFLVAKILQSSGLKIEVVDVPANDLTGAYTQIDVLVCQMMHSNILSFAAGVPALNIAYDSKNFGFNELIGMQHYCVSACTVTLDQLVEKMTELIGHRTELGRNLEVIKSGLETQMNLVLSQIRALVLDQRVGAFNQEEQGRRWNQG